MSSAILVSSGSPRSSRQARESMLPSRDRCSAASTEPSTSTATDACSGVSV
jgi:hypothetical protein